MTIDIEKAFDSLDHNFLISALEKFGFGKAFVDWIKVFLNEQKLYVVNGGITTKYFKLENGERQGDSVSAYLFILIFLYLFKDTFHVNKKNIKGKH